jgi:hypothetical protein
MNSQSTYSDRAPGPADAPTRARVESDRAVAPQWRERKAERKRARLVSARNRRVLAQRLRRTAKTAHDPDPIRLHREALLHYRAAAVRTDLLEIAAMREHSRDNPACVKALHNLLADGCDSPLNNADIDPSELRATLNYVRSGLPRHTSTSSAAATAPTW